MSLGAILSSLSSSSVASSITLASTSGVVYVSTIAGDSGELSERTSSIASWIALPDASFRSACTLSIESACSSRPVSDAVAWESIRFNNSCAAATIPVEALSPMYLSTASIISESPKDAARVFKSSISFLLGLASSKIPSATFLPVNLLIVVDWLRTFGVSIATRRAC